MASKHTESGRTSPADEEVEIEQPPPNPDQPAPQAPSPAADAANPDPFSNPVGLDAGWAPDTNAPAEYSQGEPVLDSLLQPDQHQDVEEMLDANSNAQVVDETGFEQFDDARDATLPQVNRNPPDPHNVLFNPNLSAADAIALLRRQVQEVQVSTAARIREGQLAEFQTRQHLEELAQRPAPDLALYSYARGNYRAGMARGMYGQGRAQRMENILSSIRPPVRVPSRANSLFDSTGSSFVVNETPAFPRNKQKRPILEATIPVDLSSPMAPCPG
jgi:hypothetical protein